MQFRQRLADTGAMTGIRPAHPQAVEEGDDRRGPAGDAAEHAALPVLHRLRTIDTARGEMLHQCDEERQIGFRDTLLVEREDEISRARVHQEIGVLDTFRDALVGQQLSELVAGEEAREVVGGDVGVDGHLAAHSAA